MLQLLMGKRYRLHIYKKGNPRLLVTDMKTQIELSLVEHQAQHHIKPDDSEFSF